MRSAAYTGDVFHTRRRPRRHRLHYRVFSLLLDLDELPDLDRRLRLFGHDRPALFSFRESDHGAGVRGGLRTWVEARLAEAGLDLGRPRIEVLCYPRILGYVFNPLTLYFCSDEAGTLKAVLYEVSNTYGERMTYIIPVEGGGPIEQQAPKRHFVSPFMPMDCVYRFHIEPPEDRVLVRIDEADPDGPLLAASFSGERQPLTDAGLLRLFFRYPLMTLKVTLGIHVEAIRLLLKGLRIHPHPKIPERVASLVVSAGEHPPGEHQPQRVG